MFRSIIGVDGYKKDTESPAEKFSNTLRSSAKCRFIASDRLRSLPVVTSHTTTILSLVMILIPLLQVAGVKMHASLELLTAIQIFIAICILVYSVINTQAKYGVRAEKLNMCGNKILKLQRELYEKIKNGDNIELGSYRKRYEEIEVDSENHAMSDFYFAKLRLKSVYKVTGLRRFYVWVNAVKRAAFSYLDVIILFAFVLCLLKELLTGTAPITILGYIG
ncbi:TPA: SLATT domain-containing protein [Vibrio vulnificus]|nr:SLATT domain-containing protein [Vibrio vulnificus]ELC9719041.1 SLATT domain-containing protein [Vibrio vulnificus]ELS0763788.1 SLATT domain-containing protein [Vibrio vulnificus]ELV8609846.1 SLATT domain-containing protein [Vibrio vulnificus]ELV8618635.1 SLATT domain-containing protein [Vibrio vulnificus]